MNAPSERWSRCWAWAVIILPLVALTDRTLVTNEVFGFRDAAHYYYPQLAWEDRQWRAGTLPLWNPQDNLGTPVAADPTAALFYPGKLLFRLPLPFPMRYNAYILVHLFGAAAGAYVAARTWRCSRPAAALAAISYACGGNVLFLYSNVVYLVGAAWLPWGAALLERLARAPSPRALAGFAAALAMMILGGDPQCATHLLLIGLVRAWLEPPPLSPPSPALPSVRSSAPSASLRFSFFFPPDTRRRQALMIVAAGAIAFALSAPQAIPTWLASRESVRAAYDEPRTLWEVLPWLRRPGADAPRLAQGLIGPPREGTHHAQLYDFSVGPWRLVELLVPNAFGKMFPHYARWGFAIPAEGRIWTPSLYQGLLPALLVLAGLLAARKPIIDTTERWLRWTAMLTVLGGCGSYGLGWLVREICGDLSLAAPEGLGDATGGLYWLLVMLVPSYVQFRYPAKLWTIAALAIAGLAARGFDRVTATQAAARDTTEESARESSRAISCLRRLAFVVTSASASLLIVLPVCRATGHWQRWLSGVVADPWLGPLDTSRALVDTLTGLGSSLILAAFAWWLTSHAAARAAARRWLWVVVTAIDLVVAHHWLVVTAPADAWQAGAPTLTTVGQQRYWRLGSSGVLPHAWQLAGADDRLVDTVRWDSATLLSKMHLLGDASSIDAPVAAESLDYHALLQAARSTPRDSGQPASELQRKLRDLLGVGAALAPERSSPANTDIAAPRVTEHARDAPRAWLAHQIAWLPTLPVHAPEVERQRARHVLLSFESPRDGAHTAVVEGDEHLVVARKPRPEDRGSGQVRILDEELHRLSLAVELPSPALLVVADRYDPDWRVSVRDEAQQPLADAAIVRTNHVCRGVFLPAGRWTVEFVYRPTGVYLGLVVSGLSWLAWIVVAIGTSRRRDGALQRG